MSATAPIDSSLTADAESLTAAEVVARMVERFHPRLYLACSFQQEESVLIDLLLRIEPEARIFTLDTGVLFPETYETWRTMEERYGVEFEAWRGMSLSEQEQLFGPELWKSAPDRCCGIRKVVPLRQALSQVDAWIVGRAPRPGADARQHAQDRLGREAGDLEGRAARRLERERHLALHPRARPAVQPARTTAATRRSAARTARCRPPTAAGAGRATTRSSAAFTADPVG